MVDKLKLRMGKPLLINKEHDIYVHPPMMCDIVDMGEDEYSRLYLPFVLTKDSIFGNVENGDEISGKFNLLQMFFTKIDEKSYLLDGIFDNDVLKSLEKSLSFFLKTDKIKMLERQQKIVVNDFFLIDDKEFENIRKAIQGVTAKKDLSVEKPPKNMTSRQKDVWRKLQKGRRRKANREAIHLQDIVNYVSFGGKSFISTSEIAKMSYYELDNAYKSIIGVDSYERNFKYQLSPKFDIKDKVDHWTDLLKIGK